MEEGNDVKRTDGRDEGGRYGRTKGRTDGRRKKRRELSRRAQREPPLVACMAMKEERKDWRGPLPLWPSGGGDGRNGGDDHPDGVTDPSVAAAAALDEARS